MVYNRLTMLSVNTQKCIKCGIEKELINFPRRSCKKSGFDSRCKACMAKYQFEYNQKTNYRNNYRKKNIIKARAAIKDWSMRNRDKLRTYDRNRKLTNINYKIMCNLRNRIYQAIKNNYKAGSAVADLGCSIEKFKLWIEMFFQDGMSWNNHGKWHLDHKIPLSKFDLSDRNQFLDACNYTNIQPLWAEDNLTKGNKTLTGDIKNG